MFVFYSHCSYMYITVYRLFALCICVTVFERLLQVTSSFQPFGRNTLTLLVYCGQTVGMITTPLGTEVGLGPGDNVLDGNPAPHRKGQVAPTFWPMSIVAKRSPISQLLSSCYQINISRRCDISEICGFV